MIIVWRGPGIVVLPIVFGFSLVANLICNSVTGGKAYWAHHGWPFALSLLASAALCHLLGKRLPEYSEFFFIKMKLWALILGGLGLILLVIRWSPG